MVTNFIKNKSSINLMKKSAIIKLWVLICKSEFSHLVSLEHTWRLRSIQTRLNASLKRFQALESCKDGIFQKEKQI